MLQCYTMLSCYGALEPSARCSMLNAQCLLELYCTVLYCTVLYCTMLYSTLLYSTLFYSTLLHHSLYYLHRTAKAKAKAKAKTKALSIRRKWLLPPRPGTDHHTCILMYSTSYRVIIIANGQ